MWIPHCGQVDYAVPFDQQLDIGCQSITLIVSHFDLHAFKPVRQVASQNRVAQVLIALPEDVMNFKITGNIEAIVSGNLPDTIKHVLLFKTY